MHIIDVLYVLCVGLMICLYHTERRVVGDTKICYWLFYIPRLILINPALSQCYVDFYLILGVLD
jgi:hypothetical protein